MLKPLDRTGGTGVIRIDEHNARAEIERVDYAPILTQAYVEGADRCISLACREGKVLRQAIYEHERGTFRFFADAALTEVAAEIVSALNLTGLVNFDARITTDGTISMIECNPRFTFNMDVAMVAGLNFADWTASSPGSLPEQEIRIPKALARALLSFQKPLLADFRMLLHWLKDPLIFALVSIGYPQRWRLPVAEQAMTSGKSAV
jgi:predicted ATP-grasp superfamily ATP-dependent carboligase